MATHCYCQLQLLCHCVYQAGALADPDDPRRYNPFDGKLTFVGEVLASLPLNIELGKVRLSCR